MRALRGRPAIVTFLYTTCEETCPAQAQQIKIGLDRLGRDIPALAIAVKPETDTPTNANRFLVEQGMVGRMDIALGSPAASSSRCGRASRSSRSSTGSSIRRGPS